MTLDVHDAMQGLAESRPIFHSEADFQFALAWRIKEVMPACEVRLEFKPFPDEGMHFDIWLPTAGMMIELKYLTRSIDTEYNGERLVLKDGTRDAGRYDFLKDVERLERVVSEYEPARRGIAILLANEYLHWESPRANWQSKIDAAFRIHEGRERTGTLEWAEHAGAGSKDGKEAPIILTGSYTMHWCDYSDFRGEKNGKFRYLAVSVED